MKKSLAADYLIYDEKTDRYIEDPEQAVRDDVEKHYWLHVVRTVIKDWRLYVMLLPMLLVFLFWRYFPMYELLGCFKVSDNTLSVADQLFAGFYNFKRILESPQEHIRPQFLRTPLRISFPHNPGSFL